MIKLKIFTLFLSLCFAPSFLMAQNKITDDLQTNESWGNEGTITIDVDPYLTLLIGSKSTVAGTRDRDAVTAMGYRLRVFMGNDPRTAETEAKRKRNQIQTAFPELGTYVEYDAPNWKLEVGDFLTLDEAMVYRRKIQKEFPQFGKEVYQIPKRVKVVSETYNSTY